MAESSTEYSWWGWILDAKDKVVNQSNEVFEFVKKDINEFTKVVGDEASSVVSTTASVLKEKLKLDEEESTANQMKKSVSGFLNHVSEVFTPPPDDDDQEAILIQNQQPVSLNRLEASVYSISQDQAIFLSDPEDEGTEYESWIDKFELESHQAKLSQLLVDNAALRQNYTLLVPAQVSHSVFWHRYFYKVEKLKMAENKRQELKERAELTDGNQELLWDEDDFDAVDISEQLQKQLLEDYQKEWEEQERKTKVSKDKENSPSKTENVSSAAPELEIRVPSVATDSSNEEEWEKVEPPQPPKNSDASKPNTDNSQGEDWENWK